MATHHRQVIIGGRRSRIVRALDQQKTWPSQFSAMSFRFVSGAYRYQSGSVLFHAGPLGEYVSVSSQTDSEAADLDRERRGLEAHPEAETEEQHRRDATPRTDREGKRDCFSSGRLATMRQSSRRAINGRCALIAISNQTPSLIFVARRISSDSLGSLTARARTRAPTSDARVASACSSRCRCFKPASSLPLN